MTKTNIITYIGRRFPTGSKTLKHFYLDEEGQAITYKRVLLPAAKIGALIQVTRTEDDRGIKISAPDGPKIVGYHDSKIQVLDWEAASIADVMLNTQRRQEKVMNREQVSELETAIRVISAATLNLNRTGRAALVAHIIERVL